MKDLQEQARIDGFRAHLATIPGGAPVEDSDLRDIAWKTDLTEISLEFGEDFVEIYINSLEIGDPFMPRLPALYNLRERLEHWRAELAENTHLFEKDFRARMILTHIFSYQP